MVILNHSSESWSWSSVLSKKFWWSGGSSPIQDGKCRRGCICSNTHSILMSNNDTHQILESKSDTHWMLNINSDLPSLSLYNFPNLHWKLELILPKLRSLPLGSLACFYHGIYIEVKWYCLLQLSLWLTWCEEPINSNNLGITYLTNMFYVWSTWYFLCQKGWSGVSLRMPGLPDLHWLAASPQVFHHLHHLCHHGQHRPHHHHPRHLRQHDWLSSPSLDILPKHWSITNYQASLGHKVTCLKPECEK